MLGERVGRREILSVSVMVAGIALLAWSAPPRDTDHASGAGVYAAIGILAAIALVPYGLALLGRSAGLLIAVGAGAAYAIDGLATKFFSDDFSNEVWISLVAWGIVMGLAAGVATLSEMSALQNRPATQVAPIILALTTLIPVALAPVFAGETWSADPWLRVALGASILLIVGGASVLATSPAVGAVLDESGNGTAESEDDESEASTRSSVDKEAASDEASAKREHDDVSRLRLLGGKRLSRLVTHRRGDRPSADRPRNDVLAEREALPRDEVVEGLAQTELARLVAEPTADADPLREPLRRQRRKRRVAERGDAVEHAP